MRILVQRSLKSSVSVDGNTIGSIDNGLVILVGFTHNDSINDINYMVKKVLNLRIFDDENGQMNKSILDVGGNILSISQFTLYGDTKKGNRPSYVKAMGSTDAVELYNVFNNLLGEYVHVETGMFGADMKVEITNNGPVTILLESGDTND